MQRLWISLATAIWGGTTLLAILGLDQPDGSLCLMASAGAGLAGAAVAPLFARRGPGWSFAAVFLATSLGASLASALALGRHDFPLSLLLGPYLVWHEILNAPHVTLIWLAGAFAVLLIAWSLTDPAQRP